MSWTRIFAWLGLALAALAVAAGEGDKPEEKEEEKRNQLTLMETIVVSAERAPVKAKETTGKATVITDERIEKELIQNIRDLVRYEPGVYVENDGGRLGLNGFNIRGVGGNRVLTQVDGVRAGEQFDFGPFSVHQYFVDVDSLKSVEILRSAGSSLYGSDALGGAVSFVTKDPSDYLGAADGNLYIRLKSGYDSRDESVNGGVVAAFSSGSFEGMASATLRTREAVDNQGVIDTFDRTRTLPNDIDAESAQYMFKGVWRASSQNRLRLTIEHFDAEAETLAYSQQGSSSQFGALVDIADSVANDEQSRLRLSLDQAISGVDRPWFDSMEWKLFHQTSETDQDTSERRTTTRGPAVQRIIRTGVVDFEQDNYGADILLRKTWNGARSAHRVSYGAAIERFEFGQLRDRRDFDIDTGNPDAYTGTLIFPTRYFPDSEATQYGVFIQSESYFFNSRLKIVPGLRYDRYRLSPDENDQIFRDSVTTDPPASMDDQKLSPKLGVNYELSDHVALSGQYARGFRAPPYSSVNSGFTNLAGGYQTLPNPDLEPETSDNIEFAVKAYNDRGSINIAWFDNRYDDFINNTAFIGVSPQGLALFQALNVDNAEIQGVEIAGDYFLTPEWRLRASFADIDGEDRENDQPLASIEPARLALGLRFQDRSNRWGGELNGSYSESKSAGDVPRDGSTSDPFLPDSWTAVDLTLFWNIRQDLTLFLGGFNLTDETYYLWSDVRGRAAADPTIARYSAPGRSLSFNLSYQW